MLGILSGLKTKIIVGVILIAVFAGGYFYIQKLQSDIEVMNQNITTLEQGIETQRRTIDAIRNNMEIITKRTNQLQTGLNKAVENSRNRTQVFDDVDVKRESRDKPDVVEKAINEGAKDVFRELENVTNSGSK